MITVADTNYNSYLSSMLLIIVIALLLAGPIGEYLDNRKPYRPQEPIMPAPKPTIIRKPVVPEKPVPCEVTYKNIAKTDNPLWWFPCPHPDLPQPSPAEALVIEQLNRYKIKWCREISFYGLQVRRGSYPRYDFLIETDTPVGCILIEYDGEQWHDSDHTQAMDKLKDKFCKQYNVPLYRLNKTHYYRMEATIQSILSSYKIFPRK